MDIYSVESFCDRWIAKADAYRTDELEDLFDRFFTLFVVYNQLYSASAEMFRVAMANHFAQGPATHGYVQVQGDRQEATAVMARLIRASRFRATMAAKPAAKSACQAIATLLLERRFFLHSVRGTTQPD